MNSKETRPSASQPDFSMEDFARALDQEDRQFEVGQLVRGTIFKYESSGIYVDVKGKSLAFLPAEEAVSTTIEALPETYPLQSEHQFLIIREQNDDGQITLSHRRLLIKQVWQTLQEMQQTPQTLAVRVTGLNRGGVTVDYQGVRGFIPRSHLAAKDDLESLKGKILTVSLLEVNPETQKLVLSERNANRAAGLSQWAIGQLVVGKVSSIKPFGLFIEFGNTTGLLHINQISKTYISSLEELFQVGQEVKVVILDIDESKGRVSLSTKVLENFPGEMVKQMAEVMANAEVRWQQKQTHESANAPAPTPDESASDS